MTFKKYIVGMKFENNKENKIFKILYLLFKIIKQIFFFKKRENLGHVATIFKNKFEKWFLRIVFLYFINYI